MSDPPRSNGDADAPHLGPDPTLVFKTGDLADVAVQYERYAAELDEWDAAWFTVDLKRMDPQLAALAQKRRDAAAGKA